MNEELQEKYLSGAQTRAYEKGQFIVTAGDPPDSLFLIISGSVSVSIEDADGNSFVVGYRHTGEFCGEMGLFEDINTRSASLTARTDCELAWMKYPRFLQLASREQQFMLELSGQLARRLRSTTTRLSALALSDVATRIESILHELGAGPEGADVDGGISLSVRHEELANLAGCTREAVTRSLKSLEEQGRLRRYGRTIVLPV